MKVGYDLNTSIKIVKYEPTSKYYGNCHWCNKATRNVQKESTLKH